MFKGADVDGLDRIATISTAGADATDAVKAVCEALVAAGSLFGPAGAAFISYLKTTVIPWLNVVSTSLRSFATVLKAASTVQRAVSSGETVDTSSVPAYQSPEQLPAGDARNYPVVSEDGGSSSGASAGGGASDSGAATADACGKDGGDKAEVVPTADSCDKDGVKTETVATGNDKDTVKTENLGKDDGGGSSSKDGDGDSSSKDSTPKPPASGGEEPELEFLGQPVVDEHDALASAHDPAGANVTKVMFFEAGADGGLDVQTGLAIGLAGAGAFGLAKLAYGKRNQGGATTVDEVDEPPARSRTAGDTFTGGGHNARYGVPAGIDAFPGANAKTTVQSAAADKLVAAVVEGRGQLNGAATGGLKVGGYAGLAHGLGGPAGGLGGVDIDGLASRASDQAPYQPSPAGNGHGVSDSGTQERQSGHGAATVAPVWPNRNR